MYRSASHEEDKIRSDEALLTPDATSTVPPQIMKGDWVLFHPVYSPSELQAVEVRGLDIDTRAVRLSGRPMIRTGHAQGRQYSRRQTRRICGDPGKVSAKRASHLPHSEPKGTHRRFFDVISGYKHKPIPHDSNMSVEDLIRGGYILSDKQWLAVCIASSHANQASPTSTTNSVFFS